MAEANAWRAHWPLDPDITFLNHGSFGACPTPILELQRELRARMEANPVRFLVREVGWLLDSARRNIARFVNADPEELAFVSNATSGVNAVLRSLPLKAGDEVLTTTHAYNACRNALAYVAERAGARVVTATIPFPVAGEDEIVDAVMARVGPRTRLVLVDHVTSPTALVFPVARIVAALAERGIDVLVDGAHGPAWCRSTSRRSARRTTSGTGTSGSARRRSGLPARPAGSPGDRAADGHQPRRDDGHPRPLALPARVRLAGSIDPTPMLCLPAAIKFLGELMPGGWDALRERNRALALAARRRLCDVLGVPVPCPDALVASLVAVPIPDGESVPPGSIDVFDPLQVALYEQFHVETLVAQFPARPHRVLRFSAHAYNDAADYERLTDAVAALTAGDRR
jgi:isopenicillin-N epimerase